MVLPFDVETMVRNAYRRVMKYKYTDAYINKLPQPKIGEILHLIPPDTPISKVQQMINVYLQDVKTNLKIYEKACTIKHNCLFYLASIDNQSVGNEICYICFGKNGHYIHNNYIRSAHSCLTPISCNEYYCYSLRNVCKIANSNTKTCDLETFPINNRVSVIKTSQCNYLGSEIFLPCEYCYSCNGHIINGIKCRASHLCINPMLCQKVDCKEMLNICKSVNIKTGSDDNDKDIIHVYTRKSLEH